MQVSCSTLCFETAEYPDTSAVLDRIRELGFRALDLAAVHGWQNVDPAALIDRPSFWFEQFPARATRLGLSVVSLNGCTSRALNDPDEQAVAVVRAEFAALLDFADVLRCPNITLQPGSILEGRGFAESFDVAATNLSALVRLRESRRSTLSLEAHAGSLLEKPADALRMVRGLWPAAGLTYDPSHFVMQGVPLRETEPLLDYTAHVHVRNASPDNMQAAMADGEADFAWMIPALRAHGYDGAVTIEYFSGFDNTLENTMALRDLLLELGVRT